MARQRIVNNKRRIKHIYKRKNRKGRKRNQKGGIPWLQILTGLY